MRKFTDTQTNTSKLLGADSMHGANVMDGRFKIFTIDDMIKSTTKASSLSQIKEEFYVEIPHGANCIEHFSLDNGQQELIVTGLDDGTV